MVEEFAGDVRFYRFDWLGSKSNESGMATVLEWRILVVPFSSHSRKGGKYNGSALSGHSKKDGINGKSKC